jgi:hypothetical protein
MEGDADPGFVRQFEDFFEGFLDKKAPNLWATDTGSEGRLQVNKNEINLELDLKDEEFRYNGFNKEIKL